MNVGREEGVRRKSEGERKEGKENICRKGERDVKGRREERRKEISMKEERIRDRRKRERERQKRKMKVKRTSEGRRGELL